MEKKINKTNCGLVDGQFLDGKLVAVDGIDKAITEGFCIRKWLEKNPGIADSISVPCNICRRHVTVGKIFRPNEY